MQKPASDEAGFFCFIMGEPEVEMKFLIYFKITF